MDPRTNSPIINEYRRRTPGSEKLAAQALGSFPSGITHDSRYTTPYGIYVENGLRSRKWDVDGNEYVDYFGGHGAMLLGHREPTVEKAVAEALTHGTHFGSSHIGEIAWAACVQRMVPSAERVRFTSSGTEATHIALRLARAFTGRAKLLRFRTHFHGWHDHMAFGVADHFDGTPGPGVLKEISDEVVLADPGDIDGVAEILENDKGIAAVMLEPTGASNGMVPVTKGFLEALRELTTKHGALLMFDEVVTGFRVSPGGAQAHFGVTPDLTSLAKILSGGMPGGAVVGRKEILDWLDFQVAAEKGFEKIPHPGTYNANPISAAAGRAALEIIETGDACAKANGFGARVRERLNDLFIKRDLGWVAYGQFSEFHLFLNPQSAAIDPANFDPLSMPFGELKAKPKPIANKLRLALLAHGVDIMGSCTGIISATHDDADLEKTLDAFDQSITMLKAEETLPRLR